MIEDRNELTSKVWPVLRMLCRSRAVEFVEVDLRWGVTEEQSHRQETVRHCLAEIKRCRPYFIGLLGERYGWVPGAEAYSPALLDEEDWLRGEVAKRSITELEILHGVLNDPDAARRSCFYFRDPKYAQTRSSDHLSENDDDANRQTALKQRIRSVCLEKNIPLREPYANPPALAELVLADLTAAIDAEFPLDQVPDAAAREDRDHEAYARSRRTEFYVGRDEYFDRLDNFVHEGNKERGLTVLGESGGGKSALLANWVAYRRLVNPDDFLFQHYVGSSPMSAGHLALMRRLIVAIIRWCDDAPGGCGSQEDKIPLQAEGIVKVFHEYLGRLAVQAKQRGLRAVIVLDALNQLEDRERGRLLAWLPYRLPGDVRLVVSTLPGDTLSALEPRGWPTLTVDPLTADERVQLIARYLAHFSQGLSEARARKIAAVTAASNPLYLKTLLDDLRATGDHDRLDTQIANYLQASDIPALLGKILARYERDYERDRPGLVRDALSLLWAARRGLTEPELLEVLKPVEMERLPAAFWSPLRCALEDGLVDRDGILAFANEHLRVAVEQRYAVNEITVMVFRLQLANYFAGRPVDARSCDELPWLLHRVGARKRLRACLLDIERFLLIRERNQEELFSYWVWLGEQKSMGRLYHAFFKALAGDQGPGKQRRDAGYLSYAANQLGYFLNEAMLHAEAESLLRFALAIQEQSYGTDHLKTAAALSNLAVLLAETNRLDEAEPFIRRALAINEQSYGKDHPNVASALNNLAELLVDTNRLDEAEPLMRRALAINEQSYSPDHAKVVTPLNNLAQLLFASDRQAEAEPLMRRALVILERSYGRCHHTVGVELINLAGLLVATDRQAEAEPLIRRALVIFEQSYGEDHPKVAVALNNLAQLLIGTDRLTEAEPLMRRALTINEQSYGTDHTKVGLALNNLAQLLNASNRLTEAEPLMRRALVIFEQSYGEDHPKVAVVLNNLAQLLQDTDRLAEAEPLMLRALAIKALGKCHPGMATTLSNKENLSWTTKKL